MAKLQLSFACGLYDRMQPLYTGEVKPDGIDLNFIPIDQPRPIFDRMSGGQEFDVAEYSASEFTQRFANNECPFVAIPVFPSIAFRHGLHCHQQEVRHQDAQGSRRQTHRRAALYDDRRDLHQRDLAPRIRRRSLQGPLGAERHERGRLARQPDRAAAAEENDDREQHIPTKRSASSCRGRGRRHARHQPAGRDPHQSRTSPGCFRISSRSTRTCTSARASIRSCTWSRSRRASTSDIRSWRRASTTPS